MQPDFHEILHSHWGFDQFRPPQKQIIEAIAGGKDTLALLPTGGGKSICFQVPALAQEGVCLVISPLIALMKDQVENLKSRGIASTYIYSGQTRRQQKVILENMANGAYKFVYCAPERLRSDIFLSFAQHTQFSFLAIDEAHCVSQWGFDFRPEYLRINEFRTLHPNLACIALTASATPVVFDDIVEKLNLQSPAVFRKSFLRSNLSYVVLREETKNARLLKILGSIQGSGIIYSRNRRGTEEIAKFLREQHISADHYHAGLSVHERDQKQDAWINNRTRIMVCTNAFGMGIDKPDVRLVVHYEPSDSIESYYQEAGRAGRDGQDSWCVMLISESDQPDALRRLATQFPEKVVVENIYNALCNYFSVAFHSGQNQCYDFDLNDFCNKFELKPLAVTSSLKILDKMGLVRVSDGVYIPASIKVAMDKSQLYEFQLRWPKYDALIQTLLRSYGGIFSEYKTVRVEKLAERMMLPSTQIKAKLEELQEKHVIDYQPARDKPFVTFIENRLTKLNWQQGYIKQTKERAEERLAKMFDYATVEACRSNYIRTYFGEVVDNECGKCDYCRKKHAQGSRRSSVRERIKVELEAGEMTLNEVIDRLEGFGEDRDFVLEMVDELLDIRWLDNDNGVLKWIKEQS